MRENVVCSIQAKNYVEELQDFSIKVKNYMQIFPVDNGFYFSIFFLVSVGIDYRDFYFEDY